MRMLSDKPLSREDIAATLDDAKDEVAEDTRTPATVQAKAAFPEIREARLYLPLKAIEMLLDGVATVESLVAYDTSSVPCLVLKVRGPALPPGAEDIQVEIVDAKRVVQFHPLELE